MSTWTARSVRALLAMLAVHLLGWHAFAASPPQQAGERLQPWPERVIALAESLPVQDGGRIKPLSTYAGYTLLRFNGKRSVTTAKGEKLSSAEWFLDTLFFPDAAANYPVFLVQKAEVIEALRLSHDGKRERDRYSFHELRPAIPRLYSLAHDYGAIDAKAQSPVQAQVLHLAENVRTFERMLQLEAPALIPPDVSIGERAEWFATGEVFQLIDAHKAIPPVHSEILAGLQSLARSRADTAAFEREFQALHTRVVGLATARGEYGKVELERTYYKAGLLSWSLALFCLAFLLAAVLWLRPATRVLYAATWTSAFLAAMTLVAAIVFRCVIRGRPPVSTLYESVLFVTAVGALVALMLELQNRQRIALSAASFLGMVGLFVANGYELLDKQDTMPSLVAVLDTNFWLATHVTSITIGYAAGLLAALLANIYLASKLLRLKRKDPAYFRGLARMVYGVVCFGLIFSIVGTILGGVWANESWGRFWGWDPKENGALLIVLTQIAILHGRLGGYLREQGLCLAAAFGGSVIAFSWWGVNLLGVGLHSYGFTSGIHGALWGYYVVQWGLVLLAAVAGLLERRNARTQARKPNSSTRVPALDPDMTPPALPAASRALDPNRAA